MDEVVLARHGESEAGAKGIVGGDTPLTAAGRAQAAALGSELAGVSFEVCLTSRSARARETAAIALAGRDLPCAVVDELGDIDFGQFEGRPLDEYRAWIAAHEPVDRPPGGESRVATLRRFCRAYRSVLARAESRVLVVAHGLTLTSLRDERPRPLVTGAAYGSWLRLTRAELEQAVARVERWCEAPSW